MKTLALSNIGWVLVAVYLFTQMGWNQTFTKQEGEAILTELGQIREELEHIKQKPLPNPRRNVARLTTVSVPTVGSPSQGDPKAPITIVEFTDYQCPYCRKFFKNTYPELKKRYIDTGKIRLVLRDLPLGFHADARPAAEAARCAGEQGKFWPMHDALFESGGKIKRKDFLIHAKKIGVDASSFQKCLDSGRFKENIDRDIADAGKASITGTPGFVLGKTTDDIIEGPLISGAQSFVHFKRQIDRLMTQLGAPS